MIPVSTLQPLNDTLFKKPAGWECETCLVQNKPEDDKCIACTSAKPKGIVVAHAPAKVTRTLVCDFGGNDSKQNIPGKLQKIFSPNVPSTDVTPKAKHHACLVSFPMTPLHTTGI